MRSVDRIVADAELHSGGAHRRLMPTRGQARTPGRTFPVTLRSRSGMARRDIRADTGNGTALYGCDCDDPKPAD